MEQDFVGRGWRFPLAVSSRGGIALAPQEADVDEAIRLILETAKGERRMRLEFGSRLHELAFAPNDATTAGLAASHVREALGWWEPRIQVTDVAVEPNSGDPSQLLIHIHYSIRATNDERNLVYPFYLINPEG